MSTPAPVTRANRPARGAELELTVDRLAYGGNGVARREDGYVVFVAGGVPGDRVRAVVGKGGMGARTLAALKEAGAVYLNAIGGAAQFYARTITAVDGVSLMEFGTPEAMWHLWVRDFPAIVTMDAHGNSLHKDLEADSGKKLEGLSGVRL